MCMNEVYESDASPWFTSYYIHTEGALGVGGYESIHNYCILIFLSRIMHLSNHCRLAAKPEIKTRTTFSPSSMSLLFQ